MSSIEHPSFETERLVIKPRTLEHCSAIQEHFNNWNVIQYLNENIPWPYPENGSVDHYVHTLEPMIKARECFSWVICEKETPKHAIGSVEYRLKNKDGQGDRGFWLAEPYWGRGYMTEAIECLNDYIFFDVGVPKLRLSNFKTNVASRRVKEKTGTTFIETRKEQWRGQEIEVEFWELTVENWKAYREQ